MEDKKEGGLSQIQKEIKAAIETNNSKELVKLLDDHPEVDVDFTDEDKMTPLQQASYRGATEMVRVLLERGADVNKCEHEHDYTTLHFGALSGNVDVCHLLLAAGVKTHTLNSINRTASQLASFVGYHNVVSTINNFIPKSDVDYYTRPQGVQVRPYLDPSLGDSFYKFVLLYNMHPVKIAMLLQSYKGLVDNIDDVIVTLRLMSEREMKRKETNEVLSFKFYYVSYVVNEISKLIKARRGNEEKTFIEVFSKKLLKANAEYLDAFVRESVREFPYIDSTLFRQMVASLAQENAPSALSVVSAAVNGRRAFVDESTSVCETCGEERPSKKCAKCRCVSYCDRECQRLHWFAHKKTCSRTTAPPNGAKNIDVKELSNDLQSIIGGNQ